MYVRGLYQDRELHSISFYLYTNLNSNFNWQTSCSTTVDPKGSLMVRVKDPSHICFIILPVFLIKALNILIFIYYLFFSNTVYLILGLIAMLVVLETFCELQQMKKLRKMFYLRKQKTEDELNIVDHDHLSFASVSDQAASIKEDKNDLFPDDVINASPTTSNGQMDR